jgi:uncharacterized peroxidase-related enzyme
MARIDPLERQSLTNLDPLFRIVENSMGFLPNSMLTMARVPGLAEALVSMSGAIMSAPRVPVSLKSMIAYMVSRSHGCLYCQAHTASTAYRNPELSNEKMAEIWDFSRSNKFSNAERAALTVAIGAGHSPSTVTDTEILELKKHFDDDQIAEIAGVISMFGFLNRWNDVLATRLEDEPRQFAEEELRSDGWNCGQHE